MVDPLDDPDSYRIRFCMRKLIKFMLDEYYLNNLKEFPRRALKKYFDNYYEEKRTRTSMEPQTLIMYLKNVPKFILN